MPYKEKTLRVLKHFLKASKYASGFGIAVVGFLALSMFWAWGVKLNTDSVNIFPSQYAIEEGNWENPNNILTLELPDNAISDEFTAENSAMPKASTGEDEESDFSSSITVREFDITELREEMDSRGGKSTMEISELRLMLSMAALADTGTPGTLNIEASVNSKNRHKIAEIKQNTYYSNSINEGYYSFSLDPIFSELNGRLTSNDIENLQIFVTYKTENSEPATLQIDSIWLSLDFELVRSASARPKVKLDKGENVLTYKDTFSSDESPIMTFSNPELSLQDIKNMAEADDVEVIEDKFRTLTKKNIVFEMLEEESNPQDADTKEESQVEEIVEKLEANLGNLLKKEESVEQEATEEESDPTTIESEEEVVPAEEEVSGESEDGEEDEPEPAEDNSDTKEDSDSSDNVDNVDNVDSSDNMDMEEEIEESGGLEEDVEDEVADTAPQEEEVVEETEESTTSFNPFAVKTVYAQSASIQDFSFYLVNPRGERVPAEVEVSRYFEDSREMFDVQVQKPKNSFIPGKYTLEAELETADSIVVLQQDFSWGVLAINFNKSIYTAEDSNAYVQMGVLDDFGHTLCNAGLELKVSTPNNKVSYFTTSDGSIKQSEHCNGDSYSPEPDYFVNYYLSGVEGVYDLELTATTQNGTRSVTDSFEVRDSVLFDIERTGPTRIFPLEDYEIGFNITANEDFKGEIVEEVPDSFELVNNQDTRYKIQTNPNNPNSKQLAWEVEMEAGESYGLSYVFDAPDVSPEFYLLGPLQVGEFSEARQWQIASDAILPTLLVDGDGVVGPRNWATQAFGNIDEGVSAVDGAEIAAATTTENRNASLDTSFTFGNTPADFLTMDDISYNVIYRANSSTGDDTLTFEMRIVNGATILAAADAGGTFQTVRTGQNTTWPTTATTSGATLFTFVNTTANKAAWDGAEVEFRSTHVQNMGPEDNWTIVDTVEFTGNYTPSVTNIDISGSSNVAGATVALAVNSTRQAQTATTAAGPCPCAWSITGVTQPGTGDAVTVWLDNVGDTSESTAATLYSGTGNVTGLELDANVLSIGTTGAYANQSLTVTDLSQYDFDSGSDGGDEDVMHTANSGVLDVEGSTNSYTNETIRVETGDTLTIGGTETLDTHNVQIDGTLTSGGAGTFTVSGSWDNNSVYNTSGETVTFTSTSTGETIDSTGASTDAFNDVTFNGAGGEWTVNSALSANGNLTMTAGTLVGSQNIDVLGGAVTGDGDINLTGGTFTLDGAGNFGGNTAWDFNNLTFGDGVDATTTTATGTGSITVAGTLSISANQTLDAGSKTWTLSGSGTPFSIAGVFTANGSTFDYTGTSATNITATTYNNLESSAAATVTHTLASGTITVNNNFTIGNSTDAQTVNADDQDPTLSIGGNLTINSNADLLASGTGTFEVAGSWTNSGTFTNNGGSVTFNAGSGTVNIDSTGATLDDFNNIIFDDSAGTATFLLASALDVNGDLTITGGTLDVDATGNNQVNVAGNWTNNDIYEARSGLVVLDGAVSANLDAGCTAFNDCANGNFFDLEINKTDGAEANDNVTLTSTDLNVANTLTITDGELVQGALNVQAEGTTTSVSIAGAGEWFNISTGNLILDGDFINNGLATFNANGATCGDADDITIDQVAGSVNPLPDWDGTGTFVMKDVDISNQNAVASITLESSTGETGQNNTGNWTFGGCSITIQGNVLQDDEATFVGNPPCDGATAAVSLRINGGTESTVDCDDTTGFYEFANVTPNAGDTLTIYLNSNSTPKANLVLVVGAANILDADLYQNTVIVRDEDNSTLSILDTLDWDSSTEAGSDMLFDSVSGSPNTITLNSGVELHIWTGDTFDPGGTVTTQGAGDVHVDDSATIHIDDGASVIAGDVLVDDSATFQVQQSVAIQGGDIRTSGTSAVVNYTGTPTVTISGTGSIGGGTTPSITFYNLVISGTQTAASATTTENNLTVDGTMDGSAAVTTTVNGDVTGGGTINLTGGTFEQRVAISQNFGVASGTNNWIFNNLTFSNSDGVTGRTVAVPNGTGTITINGNLLVSKSGDTASITLDAGNRTWVIAGSGGNPFDTDEAGGVLNGQSSTFEYTGDNGGGDTTVEDASYTNLTFTGAETYVPEGATSASGDLTVNTNATLGGSQNITVNGSVGGDGTINITAGTFEQRISAAETFGTAGGSNSWTFNDLTFSNADGGAGHTVSVNTGATGAVVVVNGIMRVSKSGDTQAITFNAGDKTYTLSNANEQNPLDLDLAGGVLDAQTSTFEYTGDFDAGDVHIEDASYNNLTLGGAVVESYNPSEAAITASNDLTINANGTLIGTNNVTVNGSATGAGAVNLTGGVFEQRVSVNESFGTSSDSANWIFNDLTFSNSNIDTTTDVTVSTNAGTGQIIVSQTLTIAGSGDTGGNGTTFDNETTNDRILDAHHVTINPQGILTASSTASFTISGNWTNDGALNEGSGSIEFDGTTSATIDSGCTDVDNCTSENFNSIEINKTAGTDADDNITLSNTGLRLSGTLTITDGELIQGAQNVRAEGATAVSVASSVGAKWTNTSTGNLTLGGSFSAGDGVITFQGGGASCGDFDSIQIRSTDSDQPTPTQRIWSGASATFNFNDVDVADQGTSGITITVEDGTDSTGNDAGWNFVGCPGGASTFSMRPDGDVTANWGVTGSTCAGAHWCTVNDNVDDPTAASFSELISTSGNNTVDRFTTASPTDVQTATQIIPKAYTDAVGGSNNMRVQMDVFINGTQVGTTFSCANSTGTATWCSGTAITGSWTQADIDTLEISLTSNKNGGGAADTIRVAATYAELTYTPTGITIEGNIYEDEATTALVACDGATNMVAVRVGGTTYGPTTCADASGFFSINAITQPASGTPIFIYASGCSTGCGDDATAVFSTTVIRYGGSGSINNAVARRDRLILRHDDGGPVTNLNLDTWDNADDTDIVYNVDDITNELVLEDGIKLIINNANTFTPGADVSTSVSNDGTNSVIDGDILIQTSATLGMEANALSVGGDFENAGTFSKSAGQTTTFTATATGHEITDGGNNFENIIFNGTSGGWSFADSTIVDGDITMTAGELSGTNDITVNGGDVTGTATINLTGGNFTIANSDGTANLGGGAYTFNNLTIGDGGTDTTQLNGNITVSDTLTVTANDTLDGSNDTITLNGTGTPFVINGAFAQNTSTVAYKGAGATEITDTGYWNLESSPAAAVTHRLGTGTSQSFTVNNRITVGDGTNAVTFDVDNYDSNINLNGDLQINANAVFSASDTANFNISGDFTNSGTFNHNGGGIEFDQAGTSTITGNGTVFNDFTSTTNSKALRFGAGETFQIDGLFTLTGTSGNEITIDSDDGVSQWLINHQGTEDITFTNISNSGCDASSTDINAFTADGNIDGTGNGTCWIFTEFIPASQNWRWYDDGGTALAGENTAPSNVANDTLVKLRFTIAETNGGDATDIRYKIQFSTQSDFSSGVTDVEEIGTCSGSSEWCYADGTGNDDALISGLVLTDSDTLGTHNESGTSASTFDHQANDTVEFEFSIKSSGPQANTTYFFRAYDTKNDEFVALNTGENHPSVSTAGTTLDFSITGLPASTSTEGETTDVATTATQIDFQAPSFATEVAAAHRLSITTNANSGYSLYVYERSGFLGDTGGQISPISGTNSSPTGWSTGCSSLAGCYGYHTGDESLSGASSTRFSPDDTYAQFSTTPEEVAFSPVSVSNEEHDMVYKLQVTDQQDAGNYSNNIVYIIVPVF